jgi:hypothetical protein
MGRDLTYRVEPAEPRAIRINEEQGTTVAHGRGTALGSSPLAHLGPPAMVPPRSPLGPFETGLGAMVLVLGSAVVVGVGTGLQPKLGLAAFLAVVAGLAIVMRPVAAVLAMVTLTPIICGLRRGLVLPGLRPSEILMTGVALPVLLFAGGRISGRWRALDFTALLYVAATMVLGAGNMLVRGDQFTPDLNGKLIGPLQFFLFYRSIAVVLTSPELRRTAVRLMLLASVPISISALLQFFNVGPVRAFILEATGSLALLDSQGGLFRASGIMEHWHSLGGYMVVIAMLCVALLLNDRQDVMRRGALGLILGMALLAIMATLTLVVIMATVVGLIGLGMAFRRSKTVLGWLAIGALVSVVVLGPFIGARLTGQFNTQVSQASGTEGPSFLPQTVRYRIQVWMQQYGPVLASNLLTGYGPGVPPNVNWKFTESAYITFLLRGGVPLLAIYVGLMLAAWSLARFVADRAGPNDHSVAQATAMVILLLVPMQVINPYFTNTGLPHILWGLFGVLAAAAGQLDGSRESLQRDV